MISPVVSAKTITGEPEPGEQGQMIAHGGDLGLGVAGHELGAVPAGDQRQPMRLQDRPELARLARKFAAQLDAAEAGLLHLGRGIARG